MHQKMGWVAWVIYWVIGLLIYGLIGLLFIVGTTLITTLLLGREGRRIYVVVSMLLIIVIVLTTKTIKAKKEKRNDERPRAQMRNSQYVDPSGYGRGRRLPGIGDTLTGRKPLKTLDKNLLRVILALVLSGIGGIMVALWMAGDGGHGLPWSYDQMRSFCERLPHHVVSDFALAFVAIWGIYGLLRWMIYAPIAWIVRGFKSNKNTSP